MERRKLCKHLMLKVVLLAGCSLSFQANANASQSIVDNSNRDYNLGVSDKIRVIVFNEPTLSGEFSVNANGSISLPLIGEVIARGRTISEIAADIKNKLSDGYLKQPQVSIDILTFRPYYILGEVSKPGEYPYSAGLTVQNAVATAEGFTYRANKRKVFIKSKDSTVEKAVPLDASTPVEPGDTIRIGERYF